VRKPTETPSQIYSDLFISGIGNTGKQDFVVNALGWASIIDIPAFEPHGFAPIDAEVGRRANVSAVSDENQRHHGYLIRETRNVTCQGSAKHASRVP